MLEMKDGLEYQVPTRAFDTAWRPQGLILAAGRGRRLGTKVEEIPKCLLRVGGKTLLDHQLEMLENAGIRDICVVAGYKRHALIRACRGRASVIYNEHWAETNSLYSFWLARQWVNRDVVVMNCDVLTDPVALTRLLATGSSCFAYDSSSGNDDEHMKVELSGDLLVTMSKTLDSARVHGENVGLLHFSADDARLLFAQAGAILESDGRTLWMASAVQQLAVEKPLQAIDMRDRPWIEIDFEADLEDARRRVWPLIEEQRKRAATLRETRQVETAIGPLCHESA